MIHMKSQVLFSLKNDNKKKLNVYYNFAERFCEWYSSKKYLPAFDVCKIVF